MIDTTDYLMPQGYLKVRQAFPLALETGPKSLVDTMFRGAEGDIETHTTTYLYK